jgi:hypothetical protein
MKPKFHIVLETAIKQGVSYGYQRAHKHVENPSEESIIMNIEEQVMFAIYEWFDFGEEE